MRWELHLDLPSAGEGLQCRWSTCATHPHQWAVVQIWEPSGHTRPLRHLWAATKSTAAAHSPTEWSARSRQSARGAAAPKVQLQRCHLGAWEVAALMTATAANSAAFASQACPLDPTAGSDGVLRQPLESLRPAGQDGELQWTLEEKALPRLRQGSRRARPGEEEGRTGTAERWSDQPAQGLKLAAVSPFQPDSRPDACYFEKDLEIGHTRHCDDLQSLLHPTVQCDRTHSPRNPSSSDLGWCPPAQNPFASFWASPPALPTHQACSILIESHEAAQRYPVIAVNAEPTALGVAECLLSTSKGACLNDLANAPDSVQNHLRLRALTPHTTRTCQNHLLYCQCDFPVVCAVSNTAYASPVPWPYWSKPCETSHEKTAEWRDAQPVHRQRT
mmetsp:Transcript_148336/g.269523  ORF Transcript_148336/g.269523 Transcript_148336/m.269523 type:complete len:389 (+) Transcript_148336:145-1311(+)